MSKPRQSHICPVSWAIMTIAVVLLGACGQPEQTRGLQDMAITQQPAVMRATEQLLVSSPAATGIAAMLEAPTGNTSAPPSDTRTSAPTRDGASPATAAAFAAPSPAPATLSHPLPGFADSGLPTTGTPLPEPQGVCPGGCESPPSGCLIKGTIPRDGYKIYLLPGQAGYESAQIDPGRSERWFCTVAEARAAGWGPSKVPLPAPQP